jgi:hypothetical protein
MEAISRKKHLILFYSSSIQENRTTVEIQVLCFIRYCCCSGDGVDAVVLPVLPPAVRVLRDHLPHPPPRLAGLQQARQRTRQGQIIKQISCFLPFKIFKILDLHIKEAEVIDT